MLCFSTQLCSISTVLIFFFFCNQRLAVGGPANFEIFGKVELFMKERVINGCEKKKQVMSNIWTANRLLFELVSSVCGVSRKQNSSLD